MLSRQEFTTLLTMSLPSLFKTDRQTKIGGGVLLGMKPKPLDLIDMLSLPTELVSYSNDPL